MARPGLMRHKKFARLARLIGNEVLARGHLELLWEVAYENGDDLVGDAGDLEHLTKWAGAPGALAAALLESGFVDPEGDQYRVHDLWDHAPDYVRKRRQRENERQEKGATLSRSAATDRTLTGQCPPDGAEGRKSAPNGRPRAPAPAPAPTQEAAAATRESARSDSPKLGSGAAEAAPPPPAAEAAPEPGPSASPGTAEPAVALEGAPTSSPTPAAVGHSAEAATPSTPPRAVRRASPPVEDDAPPPRKLQVLDLTDLDELGAELRVRLQERLAPEAWRPPVSAPERRISARAELERLVSGLGLGRAEELAWAVIQRRQRQGLKPPATMAFFVPMFEEAMQGGNPMPVEVAGVDVNQVLAARDAEVEARWAPLMARLTPSQREELSAEKARLEKEIRSQGLWTSQENLLFHETEGWLFEKWSRKAASGEA